MQGSVFNDIVFILLKYKNDQLTGWRPLVQEYNRHFPPALFEPIHKCLSVECWFLSCLKSVPAFFWLVPSYWLTAKLYIIRLLKNAIRKCEHPSGKEMHLAHLIHKVELSWASFFSLILTWRAVGSSSVPRCCVNVLLDFVADFMLAQLHSMLRCQASRDSNGKT